MDDLIRREYAIGVIDGWFHKIGLNPEICVDAIKALPSEQLEIIYCENCCHYPGEHTDCPLIGWGRNENDFCSYAERRIDGRD